MEAFSTFFCGKCNRKLLGLQMPWQRTFVVLLAEI